MEEVSDEVAPLGPGENEFENEELAEDGNSDSVDNSIISTIQDVFCKVKKHFGLKFTSIKPKIKFGLDLGDNVSKSVKFIVNPDLQDTFLKHPAGNDTDPIGLWELSELNFKQKNNWVPEVHAKEHPRRVPFKLSDPEAEIFFANKCLLTPNKKFSLPTSIFSPNSITLGDTQMHEFEFLGRQGVLDNEITQNMLDLNYDMVLGVSNVLKSLDLNAPDAADTLNLVVENLQNVLNFNSLSRQSNYRCKSFAILTCVKAKSELRSMVLDRYDEGETVKEMLKCSSFFTDKLFGPIPKSFTESQANCSGRKALLTAKVNTTAIKRKAPNQSNQAKRGKFELNRGNYQNVNYNNFNNKRRGFDNGGYSRNNFQETKYATSSLFPKGSQQNHRSRGGKRGSKR